MIIMDPHNWWSVPILPLLLFEQMQGMHCLIRKLLVTLDVGLPVVSNEGGPIRHGVEKGPEGTVATPIVVTVEKFRFRVDGHYLK